LLKSSLVIGFILFFLMAKVDSIEYLMITFSSLQLILHLPLMATIMPVSSVMFFKILSPMMMYDIMNPLDRMGLDFKKFFFRYDEDSLSEYEDSARI